MISGGNVTEKVSSQPTVVTCAYVLAIAR